MNRTFLKKIFSFGIVGGVGFVVDAGVLTLLSSNMGMNVYLSRLFSFTVAVFVTWMLNRRWVFKSDAPTTNKANEYISYLTVQVIGALINLGIFALSIFYFPGLKVYPIVPLAFGSVCAMFFNFVGAQVWVFKAKQS
ncbi:GtrA family protein [Caballeronia sp. KNU42]